MPFCFMIKNNHFKEKLLLWPEFPFNTFVQNSQQPHIDPNQGEK